LCRKSILQSDTHPKDLLFTKKKNARFFFIFKKRNLTGRRFKKPLPLDAAGAARVGGLVLGGELASQTRSAMDGCSRLAQQGPRSGGREKSKTIATKADLVVCIVLYHSICMGIITCCCMPLGSPAGPTGVQVQFNSKAMHNSSSSSSHLLFFFLPAMPPRARTSRSCSAQTTGTTSLYNRRSHAEHAAVYRYGYVYSVSPAAVACKLAEQKKMAKIHTDTHNQSSSHPAVWRCTSNTGEQHDGGHLRGAHLDAPNITFHDGGLPRS